jgi:hypothetical protein
MLSRAISVYVRQLPVTEAHDRAGVADLFGYPKFLADIDFVREEDWIACVLVPRVIEPQSQGSVLSAIFHPSTNGAGTPSGMCGVGSARCQVCSRLFSVKSGHLFGAARPIPFT